MPVPINLEKTDWRTIFRKLEAADLFTFGEHLDAPDDL
jgi:hypothetical protein